MHAAVISFGGMDFHLDVFWGVADDLVRRRSYCSTCCGRFCCMVIVIGNWDGCRLGTIHALFESIMSNLFLCPLAVRTSHLKEPLVLICYRSGALPLSMGLIGRKHMALLIVPLICFLVIGIYAMAYKRMTRFS